MPESMPEAPLPSPPRADDPQHFSEPLDATAQNEVGQTLMRKLATAEDEWGPLASTAEHKQVRAIQEKLAAEGGRASWADLDMAEKALQRVKGPSSVRAAIAEALKGTDPETTLFEMRR